MLQQTRYVTDVILLIWQVSIGSVAANMLTENSREHLTSGGPQLWGWGGVGALREADKQRTCLVSSSVKAAADV